jgi:Tol biopolymer transport system component
MNLDRPRRFPVALLGVAGLLLGLLIAAILLAPRVVAFYPNPGSLHAPAAAQITLVFSRPMDQSSVETRLSVDPSVRGQFSWEGERLTFRPERPWPEGSTVQVRLAAGGHSTRYLPMLRIQAWSFTVGVPRIAYLWPANGPADVYARPVEGEDTSRLTQTELGVYDYNLSRDGATLVYSAERSDGGTDLRLLDLSAGEDRLVLTCSGGERCRAPSLSPAVDTLAFERVTLRAEGAAGPVSGPSRVWAISLSPGAQPFRVGPEGHVSSMPVWSPSGRLAYYDNTLAAIVFVDLSAGLAPLAYVPSDLGLTGSWSPDGAYLVFPEIVFPATPPAGASDEGAVRFYSHILRAEARSGSVVDLWRPGTGLVEDASPAYSPDGQWIAFARKYLEHERWTLGRQLWVMRADGSGAHSLTDEPDFNYSALAWSPDSSTLVYMRFNQADLTQTAEIWTMDLDGQNPRRLIIGGYLPRWLQ